MSGLQHSLRPITSEDQQFLWDMLYLAIFVPPGQPAPPRTILEEPSIARYVAGWGRDGDAGFIAIDRRTGQPVGAAWYRCFPAEEPGYGFVDPATPELTIAILPAYRNAGLGTHLLTALMEHAEARFAQISLSCDPKNPAFHLYERLGFRPSGNPRAMLRSLKRPTSG